MADVQTVLAACDAENVAIREGILARQQAFATSEGRAWQGLATHQAKLPADGAQLAPDVGDRTPDDETIPWPTDLLSLVRRQAVSVHKYVSPNGQGFTIERRVLINGDTYTTTEDIGGHLGSQEWTKVAPPEAAPDA